MTIKVAINGYGRIGRNILRAHYEGGKKHDIQIVAVNDLGDANTNAHLTKYDTAHGKFPGTVAVDGDYLVVNGDKIRVCAERDPAKLPWTKMGIDVVMECTGLFTERAKAEGHLKAGAPRVLLSAPGKGADITVAYGINHQQIDKAKHLVISNASCTTNCLTPVAKVLLESFGIKRGLMTTIHSYTNDQNLLDLPHKDLRRARAAALSMIPSTTGAAKAVAEVIPALKGKLNGTAVRVPTPNVSLVDLTAELEKPASAEQINAAFQAAAAGPLKGILAYSDSPTVSVDYNHDPHSSIFDATSTFVIDGNFAKVFAWYDNEWGFSNRMVDVANYLGR